MMMTSCMVDDGDDGDLNMYNKELTYTPWVLGYLSSLNSP